MIFYIYYVFSTELIFGDKERSILAVFLSFSQNLPYCNFLFLLSAINGYLFGTLPGLNMCKGDVVSWHMLGLGSSTDVHGVHFQGNTIHLGGTIRDSLPLYPHVTNTALMQPDQTGKSYKWALSIVP